MIFPSRRPRSDATGDELVVDDERQDADTDRHEDFVDRHFFVSVRG